MIKTLPTRTHPSLSLSWAVLELSLHQPTPISLSADTVGISPSKVKVALEGLQEESLRPHQSLV